MERCLAVLLLACGAAPLAADEPLPDRPNIVLMMADDLGWGDLHFMGNEAIRTPHLDAMAQAGLRFSRFYAAAPVCSPTRGSCLTGRHPYRYGVYHANTGHIRQRELTLAELLKEHGYATGHFGKWHLGTLTTTIKDANRGGPRNVMHFAPPGEHGFETNFSTESKTPTFDPMIRPVGVSRRTWWDPVASEEEGRPYGTRYWSSGEIVNDNLRGDDSQVIMDRVVPFVREAVEEKRPFFAVVWFHAPHLPVVAGPQHTKHYEHFDNYKKHYYGCITALDEQVGRLRGELRELGVARNTMLTFCSDNGPEGNDKAPGSAGPLRGRKRSLFEGGVRVPGLIEWPAVIAAGSQTGAPACTSDYLPTILDILNAEMPDDRPLDGVSLAPWFSGEITERARPIGFQSRGQIALVDNRFKLIRIGAERKGDENPAFLLFDLLADEGESTDIADQHPGVVKSMAATLSRWQESCAASDRAR